MLEKDCFSSLLVIGNAMKGLYILAQGKTTFRSVALGKREKQNRPRTNFDCKNKGTCGRNRY